MLGELALLTIREPARGLRALQDLALPMSARWMMLFLAVALSALLAGLVQLIFPLPPDSYLPRLLTHPAALAAAQFAVLVVAVVLIDRVGRLFGGTGNFADALLITAWVEMVMVAAQLVQVVVMLVFPTTAVLLSVVAAGLFIYLSVALTKALHGFRNAVLVALGMVGTLFMVLVVTSMIALALGLLPEPPANGF